MPEVLPVPAAARAAILDWYERSARTLPFRATTDPWAILVSEAMAQQTQAARAGAAWSRFMGTFPTASSLAAATPADVLRAWRGLGYNRRALNLWRAARRIVEVHGGRIPADLGALEALPGVGPYTARAVAAIAFGVPVGAVDTNVRRVLGRLVAGDATAIGPAALQAIADAAVPQDRPGDWTHALMDVGATVCRPARPDCASCPARRWCRHAADQSIGRLEPAAGQLEPVGKSAATGGSVPFPATNRWLRGRIVDQLRAAQREDWTVIGAPIGTHDRAAVLAAVHALVREGLLELEPQDPRGGLRARLSLS